MFGIWYLVFGILLIIATYLLTIKRGRLVGQGSDKGRTGGGTGGGVGQVIGSFMFALTVSPQWFQSPLREGVDGSPRNTYRMPTETHNYHDKNLVVFQEAAF